MLDQQRRDSHNGLWMTHSQSIIVPSMWRRVPLCTFLLCAATAAMSVHAAIELGGTWLGSVRIVELERYGLRFKYIQDLELWRLITAQLVHVKQLHMLSNVFCLLLVGTAVERNLGSMRLLVLWLIGGSMATLISTLFTTPPWNLGTGGSQAIMAIAGAGLWLAMTGVDRSKFLILSVAFTIAVALTLDLIYAQYPKPGHAAGLLLGYLIASLSRKAA
jgi:membrane associated rhomboid family serine protease